MVQGVGPQNAFKMTKGGYGLLLQGNPLFRDAEQALEVSHIVLTIAHVYVLHNTGFHLGGGICPPPPFEFALESQRGLLVHFPLKNFLLVRLPPSCNFYPVCVCAAGLYVWLH